MVSNPSPFHSICGRRVSPVILSNPQVQDDGNYSGRGGGRPVDHHHTDRWVWMGVPAAQWASQHLRQPEGEDSDCYRGIGR